MHALLLLYAELIEMQIQRKHENTYMQYTTLEKHVSRVHYSDFQSKDDPNPKTNSYTENFLARAHLIAN